MSGGIALLLSASRHPLSGRPTPTRGELQALGLARTIGGGSEVIGLHVGPDPGGPRQALGHGLDRLVHLTGPAGTDPVGPLAAFLSQNGITTVLCGPRSAGGDETGLVPYRLAERLGWELAAGIVALDRSEAGVDAVEALPKGARRVLRLEMPFVAIAHAGAPPPAPYAFARERRGRVDTQPATLDAEAAGDAFEERPLRRRAPVVANAASGAGMRLVAPEPEAAARAILVELRRLRAIP